MNTYEAILTRHSTRKFKDIIVEKNKVEKIIEAGRLAPSGGNFQANHFFVVQNKEVIDNLASLVEKAFSEMEISDNMSPSIKASITRSKKGGYIYSYKACNLIIVANKINNGNNFADTACAIENMMLMANELDLGSCWVNQLRWQNENPELLDYLHNLGLKEDERVYGALIFGYPNSDDGMPNRKAIDITGNEVTYIV